MKLKKWQFKSKAVLCTLFFCVTVYASDKLPYVEDYWTLTSQEVEQRALAGDPFAMTTLAAFYSYGTEGYSLDKSHAKKLRAKAQAVYVQLAQEGNMAALYQAGLGYLSVEVSEDDRQKGMTMLQAAADKGYLKARIKLADLYRENGYGIATNPELSEKLYQEALPFIEEQAQSDLYAKQILCRMYEKELGGLVHDDEKIAALKQEILQEYRKRVQTSDQHALSPISLLLLLIRYEELFQEQNTPFYAYKVYTVANLLEQRTQDESLRNLARSSREMTTAVVDLEDLERAAQQCLKKLNEMCY